MDVRSLRYPGLISYKTLPGGGTTDYAIDIFHYALRRQTYPCFLNQDETLPMMYTPDAVRATIELMEAPREQISERACRASKSPTSRIFAERSLRDGRTRSTIRWRAPTGIGAPDTIWPR